MKVLRCRDMGFECNEEMRGQSEEAVLQQAAKHAQRKHGVKLTPYFAAQVRPHILDEETLRKMPPNSRE